MQYLKNNFEENDLFEIISKNLFYKKTTGKNALLRKYIEELIPEDSPYFSEITKKFIFLKQSKQNNEKDLQEILGKEFSKLEENKVIYKKIDIDNLKKNIAVIGWSIYTYEKSFVYICESLMEYFNIKKISCNSITRENKIQEITIIHNDDKLNDELFINICNKFAKLLLENKNTKDYLNINDNDEFKKNINVITNQFILEKLINENKSDMTHKKVNKKI